MKTGKRHSRLQARMMTAVNTDYPTDDNPDNSSTADTSQPLALISHDRVTYGRTSAQSTGSGKITAEDVTKGNIQEIVGTIKSRATETMIMLV